MMHVSKTISVELLRAGPPHNQLLSPLTQYLALCEGHAAETLRLPFEHHDFVLQMQSLRYQDGSDLSQHARFSQVARDMAEILRQIPGLATTAGRGRVDGGELVHIEAVLSAQELALLPFEAADSPSTFASAGLPLSLQTVVPVTLTRRNRRYAGTDIRWPRRPKILVVIASPPGFPEVPALAHVMAIRKALSPWIVPDTNAKQSQRPALEGAPRTNLEELVKVLDAATIQDVHKACASSSVPYTHVHILAHGDIRQEGVGERFALAFHGSDGDKELIDGRQLAAALRPHGNGGSGSLASPTVVTIASCDSGNVGDVMIPGGSIAHDLHEAGIPFVVASQFPLTFAGSVSLTETLYERLLWGDDPRLVLHDARQRLRLLRQGHDWASVVVYAALPPDLEQQLVWVRAQQARRAAEAALAWFDQASRDTLKDENVALLRARLDAARQRLQAALPPPGARNETNRSILVELYAMLATMDKREAEVLQRQAREAHRDTPREARELLLSARQHYRTGLSRDRANHWLATQYLFIAAILGKVAARDVHDWMRMAKFSAREDSREGSASDRAYAYASLLELCVLEEILQLSDARTRAERINRALEDAEAMVALVGLRSFEVHSTLRQLKRYELWSVQIPKTAQDIIHGVIDALEPGGFGDPSRLTEAPGRERESEPPSSNERETDSADADSRDVIALG